MTHTCPVYVVHSEPAAPGPGGSVFNVMDYGAVGDGTTDDTDHIEAAMAAALGVGSVYFPEHTYKVTNLSVTPTSLFLGESMTGTHLKGQVYYNSDTHFTDLKIGDELCSFRPGDVTSYMTATRCLILGGGATGSWANNAALIVGSRYSCDHTVFTDCDVARGFGTENWSLSLGFNTVSLIDRVGVHCEHVTFLRCHLGASNGVSTGSPRFTVECYTESGSANSFSNITFQSCVLEAADGGTLDFSDQPGGRADYIVVDDCTINGGGLAQINNGYGLCLELPLHAVVTNNRFTRAWTASLVVTPRSETSYTGPAAEITGNTFDLTTGADHTGDFIVLKGSSNRFTGNSIDGGAGGSRVVALYAATGNVVTGNTFTNRGGVAAIYEGSGCSGNTLTPNTGD